MELDAGGNHVQLPPQCAAPCEYQAIQRDHDRSDRSLVNWREYNTKLPAPDWSVGEGRVLFPDVNGDGLPDAVMSNPPGWALATPGRLVTFLNTGDGFDAPGFLSLSSPLNFVWSSTESEFLEFSATIDYDGDGQTDILVPMRAQECSPAFGTSSCWAILKADASGDGHLTFVPTKIPFAGGNGDVGIPRLVALGKDFASFRQGLIPRVADMNGDGRQDVVIPMNGTFKLFLNEGPVNLLHAVTDGMNPLLPPDLNTPPEAGFLPNITIEYGSLVDHATTLGIDQDSAAARNDTYLPRSNLAQPLEDCDYPRTCVVGPRRVVKSYELNNGQNQPRKFSTRYRNGRADRLGRGFLGFGTVIITDEDGHSGHADLYDTATKDATVSNKSPELLQPFPIEMFPYTGQVASSLSWVLGLPEVPGLPSLPVARMHFVDFSTSKNFGSPKPRLLVPTNDKTTYFTLAQQTETRDVEAAYLAADADKPLPDFVTYYGGGTTYNGGALVPYGTPANVVYKVLETSTTSKVLDSDPFGSILATSIATIDKTSSPTIDVDDHRTVTRTVDNDVLTWRLGEVTNETVCSKVVQLQSSSRCVATDAKYDGSGDVYEETTRGGDPQVSSPLPLQATTTYTRDLFGNVTNIAAYDHIAGHQREACVGYDSDGMFPVVFGNAAGHFTYVNYDKWLSKPIVAEDPNGLTTTWQHDSFGRVVLETRPDGTATSSSITRSKDGGPGASWWTLHATTDAPMLGRGGVDLDSFGRTVLSWTMAPTGADVTALGDSGVHSTAGSPSRVEQIVSYDLRGRMTSASKPYLQGDSMGAAYFTTYEYDNLGRVLAVKAPWQAKTTYSYQGNSVTVSAPGTSSTTVNDARGRTTSIVDGLNHATTYTYAHFGGLLTVSPPGNTPTTTERDAFGRVIYETDPDRGATKIGYDGFGERTDVVDGVHTESYDYDVLGRMVAKLDDVGQTTWTYDDPQKGLGRLSEVVNPAGITKSYTYKALGQHGVGQVHTVQLTAGADSLTTTLDYDGSGRLAAITLPPALGQQFKVLREYDDYGHLLRVRDALNLQSAPYWELRQINGVGQTTEEWMNGGALTTTRSYDPEKSTLDHILTTGGAVKVQDLGYTYDDRLNMKSRVDGLQLVVGAPLGEHFVHDPLDRLTCSWVDTTCHPGPGVTCPCDQQVKYKDNGNIDTKSGAGTYSYDPDHPHAVQLVDKQAYGYDKVGNQTSRPDMTVDYTPFDMPERYTRDGVETFLEYDGDQTRVRKTVKYDETLYFGDYERLTHIGSPSTVEHRYSVWSNERVVAIVTRKSQDPVGSAGTRTYVHVDHLGSTEKVTDAAGTILERRSYDAFGAKRNPDWTKTSAPLASTTMAGYTGHEDDEDLGLVNMKGRIYDPRIARFLTTDPLVSHPGFSQSWNPYSYVMNSPLKYIDPSGFEDQAPITLPPVVIIGDLHTGKSGKVDGVDIEPRRDPGIDSASRPNSEQANQAGNKDAGAPQADDNGGFGGAPIDRSLSLGAGGANSGEDVGNALHPLDVRDQRRNAKELSHRLAVEAAITPISALRPAVVIGVIAFGLLNPDSAWAPPPGTQSEDRPTALDRLVEIGVPAVLGAVVIGLNKVASPVTRTVNPRALRPTEPLRSQSLALKYSKVMKSSGGYGSFPPIEAVEIDGVLYIDDGHHRVSAAIRAKLVAVPVSVRAPTSPEHASQVFSGWAATLHEGDKGF
jgi:RHS repeat-associated protein